MKSLVLSLVALNSIYLYSFLGAIGQEILHWFNLRLQLDNQKRIFNSTVYWIITGISIAFFSTTAPLIKDILDIKINASEEAKLFIIALLYPTIIKHILKLIIGQFPNKNISKKSKDITRTIYPFLIKDYFN